MPAVPDEQAKEIPWFWKAKLGSENVQIASKRPQNDTIQVLHFWAYSPNIVKWAPGAPGECPYTLREPPTAIKINANEYTIMQA